MASRENALKARIRKLERALAKREEDALSAERIRTEIMNLRAVPPRRPAWLRAKFHDKSPGTPTLLLSDWHLGERVTKAETRVNAFNMGVARERIARTVEAAIMLAFECQKNANYQGIVVPVLGDIITGEIHDELRETNEVELLPLIPEAVDLLTHALMRLADRFGAVYAPMVPGNHGRKDKKYRAKGWATTNFDWLVYQLVEARLNDRGNARITVDAPVAAEVGYVLHEHRFFCVHGHDLGVRGGDGIIGSAGPIIRGRIKVGSQQAAMGHDFDTLLIGHWHQPMVLPGIIVNGTLKGPDEFSQRVLRAKPTPASQTLFFTHPHYGITSHWQVFCDETTRPKRHATATLWKVQS